MGLYESELTRQIHLRNRQRKEWQMLKKNMENPPPTPTLPEAANLRFQEEKRKEDRQELEETTASKQLASAMVASAQNNAGDTLQKVVDLLNNQNGKKVRSGRQYFVLSTLLFSIIHRPFDYHEAQYKDFGECIKAASREG